MRASARVLLAGVSACVILLGVGAKGLVARGDDERTLSFYNIHTKETLSVTYMRNGKRDADAMKKIDWMMRDWRRDEATTMDPELIDLIWEVHEELGSKEPIHVISGYRSPKTNEKLRRGGGGQAKFSQHILGKAADVHFPDVPLKQMRYSGLVRQQGGVGYYPTSGVPFVHFDTGRVRHWPRIPRYELALLFPNGNSKHTPADGRPVTRSDHLVAKSKYRELADQVAAFFDVRSGKRTATMVADAGARPAPAAEPAKPLERQVASLGTDALALVAAPRPATRPARPVADAASAEANGWRATPRIAAPAAEAAPAPAPRAVAAVSDQDRDRLASLFRLASFAPAPRLVSEPKPVLRRAARSNLPDLTGGSLPAPSLAAAPAEAPTREAPRVASLGQPAASADAPRSITDFIEQGWSTGFAAAPEFDEEHPDEMSYRPFPVAPLLTHTASADDPVLTGMIQPDVGRTLELLGADSDALPMRLRPGQQVAQLMWAQEFKGSAVDLSMLERLPESDAGLPRRAVRTSAR